MRFSIVGVLATLTYFIAANIFTLLGLFTPKTASVFAYIIGMAVSFTGQSRFSFKVKNVKFIHLARYIILSILGLLVSYFSIELCETYFNIPVFWGTVFTSVSIPLLSFIMMKFWVFKEDKQAG